MTELNSAKEQILAASKANNEPQQLIDRRLNARELMEKLRLPRMQRFDFRTWPLIADQPLKWIKSDTNLVEKPTADDEVLKVKYGDYMTPVNCLGGHEYPFYASQEKILREYLQREGISGERFDL